MVADYLLWINCLMIKWSWVKSRGRVVKYPKIVCFFNIYKIYKKIIIKINLLDVSSTHDAGIYIYFLRVTIFVKFVVVNRKDE